MSGAGTVVAPRAPGRRGRAWALLAGVVALGVVLAGCSSGGGGSITATAVFDDVSDLAVGAPVQLADIAVGSVSGIDLDGRRARVVMHIERSADVPADVTAEVRVTTVLGERFVELVPPGPARASATLADGATIADTRVVPDLEQLVQGGAQVFGPISASQLAVLVQAGAQGFGSEGPALHQLLSGFASVTAGYATRTADIKALVSSLDQLGSSTAPDAQSTAQSISNLARATGILADESSRFNDLLSALNGMAVQSRSLLEGYSNQIGDQFKGLASVTSAVASRQQDLASLIHYLLGHNQATATATYNRFVQVLDDLVVCGLPNGGDQPSSPAGTCTPSSAGGKP
ncbi:MAG TPA: MlaD family protein [Acidimicrobiales bacterium]|nr:MlaD family protein [Acidimicrobiales bacterium]